MYGEIYRCMHCEGATDPGGVQPFVSRSQQTIPVSHFGDIASAEVWLVATNPKGKVSDANVGFHPQEFRGRTALTDAQVDEVFDHFSKYFQTGCYDSFFNRWIEALDGIVLDGTPRTWSGGGICCVDLIKCPTAKPWGTVVRGPDKKLIYECFEECKPQRYLRRQVDLHKPRVLIFAAGLGEPRYFSDNNKDNAARSLMSTWSANGPIPKIWSVTTPARLSIGLGSDRKLRNVPAADLRNAIQHTIAAWEKSHPTDHRD